MTWYGHILFHSSARAGRGKATFKFSHVLYSRCRGPGRGGKNSDSSNDILSTSGFKEHHYRKDLVLSYTDAIREPLGPRELILLFHPE